MSIKQIGYKTLQFYLVGELHAGVQAMVAERIMSLPPVKIGGRRVSKRVAIRHIMEALRRGQVAVITWA